MRHRYDQLLADPPALQERLTTGEQHATQRADEVLDRTMIARGGSDLVFGGPGRDRIFGGNGNDRLSGNSGNDRVTGGNGKDALNGNTGNDRLTGGPGADHLNCGKGARDRDLANDRDHVARNCELS